MENKTRFEDFNLPFNILRGISANGYEYPSPIQEKAIPILMEGKELIAQAHSGAGKSLAFIISSLYKIDPNLKKCQALIISPTRELADQTHMIAKHVGQYLKINIELCIGGTNIGDCIKSMKDAQMVVATPGRLLGMLQKQNLDLSNLKMFVIDEADEILSHGFIEQIQDLIQNYIRFDTQIALFSATYPPDLQNITDCFLENPEKIMIEPEELTLSGLKQYYINVEHSNYKFDVLCDLYRTIEVNQTIIYTNSKNSVEQLAQQLEEQGFPIAIIHGEMTSTERAEVMRDFRRGSSRILLSTDLLARGIDVQQVQLVINYDLPSNKENYIHRVGRTSRYGRKGTSINIVTNKDIGYMRDIEKYYNANIQELPASFVVQ